jgi:hypothetical protein
MATHTVRITSVNTTRPFSLWLCRHPDTSGRLHSEFARLLYILAHQRAVRFFATLQYEPCDEELCQRRGAFFFQHRARIGLAGAQATALRTDGRQNERDLAMVEDPLGPRGYLEMVLPVYGPLVSYVPDGD